MYISTLNKEFNEQTSKPELELRCHKWQRNKGPPLGSGI